jgi:ribosomal protein S12 methylthiotransferase accessory factor
MTLMRASVNWRSGILARAQPIPVGAADLPLHHWSATEDLQRDRNAAGGVGWTSDVAELAAIGEGLERYAAWTCPLHPQARAALDARAKVITGDDFSLFSAHQRDAGLHHRLHDAYVSVNNLEAELRPQLDATEPVYVPAGLVALNPEHGGIATSSGLAAHSSLRTAQLRATQELLERDALMTMWVWGLAPPRVEMPAELVDPVVARGGTVTAFDITQTWNPHPVVAVLGNLPLEGRARFAMGSACRSTLADAIDKAWLEWNQGTLFAGYYLSRNPGQRLAPHEVTTFEHHAGYYPCEPEQWDRLPIWQRASWQSGWQSSLQSPAGHDLSTVPASEHGHASNELATLVDRLSNAQVQLFTRELTTVDVAQLGVRVARVLSPQLVPIHVEHGAPYLGGTGSNVQWRYPGARQLMQPSPFPHPLG